MNYLIIYTMLYELNDLMGLECPPVVDITQYEFFKNIDDVEKFIKEIKLDNHFLSINEVLHFNNYSNITDLFVNKL